MKLRGPELNATVIRIRAKLAPTRERSTGIRQATRSKGLTTFTSAQAWLIVFVGFAMLDLLDVLTHTSPAPPPAACSVRTVHALPGRVRPKLEKYSLMESPHGHNCAFCTITDY